MTHTVLTVAHYLQNPVSEFLTLISKFLENAKHRREIRKAINELSSLNDYELRDIGIGRGDIRSVVEGHSDMVHRTESNPNLKGFV